MKNLIRVSLLASLVAFAPAAFAKKGGKGTAQNHHCMMGGAEQAGKTKKACTKAGGTWEKGSMAPATTK